MAELDEILKKYTDQTTGSLHGATFVTVDGKGNKTYAKSFGSRTVDRSEPLTENTLTWVASLTKLATAVSAMQIVERGLIGLDDDVREVVPKLKDLKILVGWEGDDEAVDADANDNDVFNRGGAGGCELPKPKGHPVFEDIKGKITLRHLLTNSAGLCYDLTVPLLVKWSRSVDRKVNMFSGDIDGHYHPLTYEPGTSWQYGTGYDWAGVVVQAITSLPLEEYMQTNLWGPLDCKSMTFYPEKHFNNTPPIHETAFVDPPYPPRKGTWMWKLDPHDAMGGAGLFATADGYSRLLGALLSGGGPILKSESVDELFRPQFEPNSGPFIALNNSLVSGEEDSNVWRAYPPLPSVNQSRYDIEINHNLGGVVTLNDVPGRRKRGSLNWSGLPNLHWWVDRESGIAGVMFTQAQPMKSQMITDMFLELEAAAYRMLQQ